MLSHLLIRNLAVVTRLEVELGGGMTCLTGETGAGKSILIDALGLALGARADSGVIRDGEERAEISALFDLADAPPARDWLRQQDLDDGDQCILRRVLVRGGASRAYINDSPVPARSLQALGGLLVDIHGQHAHQSLLQREEQRRLLDEFAGLTDEVEAIRRLYRQWQTLEEELEQQRDSVQRQQQRLELLQYQTDELTRLAITTEEIGTLDLDQRRLSGASDLLRQCQQLLDGLDADGTSVRSLLVAANRTLDDMLALDPSLAETRELLESAAIQIDEAITGLRDYADRVEIDPARLEQVERRLAEVHDLARKYQCRPEELPERLESLQRELQQIERDDRRLEQLEQGVAELAGQYRKAAAALTRARRAAAQRLAAAAGEGIRSLGMPDGRLVVEVTPRSEGRPGPSGMDQVGFLVATNPGQEPRPLARVASGGELSRISLAIQVATIGCGHVPTLIFDEVDVGIGGAVAEIVGRLLRQVGERRQVLCVTHLPQVAAQARQQLSVVKESSGGEVATRVEPLDGEQRVDEIARMLGGVEITENTLAHAREMVAGAGRDSGAQRLGQSGSLQRP